MMKLLLILIITFVLGYVLISGFGYGIAKHEKIECEKWANEAKNDKYAPNYYITQWQADQCNHYGITIDAPIK